MPSRQPVPVHFVFALCSLPYSTYMTFIQLSTWWLLMEVRSLTCRGSEVGSFVEAAHISKLLSPESYLGGLTLGENGPLYPACQTLDSGSSY